MMDDNLDSNQNSMHNKIYKLKDLHDVKKIHLDTYNISQHNFKNTHFRKQRNPSCIDHIFSNCPNNINNVTTHTNCMSDHSILTANYNTKNIKTYPKFIKIRKWNKLTKNKLKHEIEHSEQLNSIFSYTDPDLIANILQIELNSIIDHFTEPKIIQFTKKYIPFYNEELRNNIYENNKLLTKAIDSNEIEDWRNFKNKRNSMQKDIQKVKTSYYKEKFENNKDKWKILKEIHENKKQQTPNNITFENKQVTSPKEMANIATNYFIEKFKS